MWDQTDAACRRAAVFTSKTKLKNKWEVVYFTCYIRMESKIKTPAVGLAC